MIFKSESLPSLFIHSLTDFKLKSDDPLKIWFDAIDWIPIHDKCFHLYSDVGAPAYNPVSMFKALLLIYLGQALSERDIAEKLQFDVRLQSLCGFDFFDTPSHVSFHDFRERLGGELFHDILHQLIAQAIAIGVIKNVIHTAIDSTHIWANSNRFGIKICQCKTKCQCLRKYSDTDAKWGHKTETYTLVTRFISLLILNHNYLLKPSSHLVKFLTIPKLLISLTELYKTILKYLSLLLLWMLLMMTLIYTSIVLGKTYIPLSLLIRET